MKIRKIVSYLNNRYPQSEASDFDRSIGFGIGNQDNEITSIYLALDLTNDVLEDALKNKANFIITHHPFLFNPINRIDFNTEQGKIIKKMCDYNLSTFSMHTNLDVASGGVNEYLCQLLGIDFEETEPIKNNFLRCGKITPVKLEEFAEHVKKAFKLKGVKVIGEGTVHKVGIVGGSGAHYSDIDIAYENGCDCYITGEVHLSNAIYAKGLGLNIIEVNHGVERFVMENVKKEMMLQFPKLNIIISSINTDPIKFL